MSSTNISTSGETYYRQGSQGGFRLSTLLFCVAASSCFFSFSHQVNKLFIVAFAVLILEDFRRGWTRGLSISDLWLMLFYVWAMFSGLWDENKEYEPFATAIDYFGIVSLYMGVCRASQVRWQWRILGGTYLLAALGAAAWMYMGWLNGASFADSGRYTVGDLNNNFIAYSIATAVPILYTLRPRITNVVNVDGLIMIFCLVVYTGAVALSGSRGALIAIVATSLAMGWRAFLRRPLSGGITVTLAVVLGIFLFTFLPSELRERLLWFQGGGSRDVSTGRFDLWLFAWNLIQKSPIIGHGVDSFSALNPEGIQTHNVFISVQVELGIIGSLLYLAAIAAVFLPRQPLQQRRATRWWRFLLLVTWLPIAMTGVWVVTGPAWFAFAWFNSIPLTNSTEDWTTST